jgi:serine/threonine-protein kinase RsbW
LIEPACCGTPNAEREAPVPSPSPPSERTLRATLPSNLRDYHAFIEKALVHLTELGWQEKDLFGIHMALEESISNAIRHGNKEDPAKQVEVECRVSPTRFWAQITDEGAGFRPSEVPDCCAPDRLEVAGGRGLALILAYMTRVQYNARGNRLTLEKLLDGAPGAGACTCN